MKKTFALSILLYLSLLITGFSQTRHPWITATKIDKLWDKGYKGEGIVIMNIDTGVKLTHPGLQNSWRGTTSPTGYDWYDPVEGTTIPTDNSGHGTATMSLMVGVMNQDTIGGAPNAKWIAARIPNNPGAILNYTLACFNWVINMPAQYRPHVISCSFLDKTNGNNNYGCYTDYQNVLQQLENLGIAVVFAAGNDGVNPDGSARMYSPQNNILSETVAFTVGGLNYDNGNYTVLSGFTSRGISSCGSPSNELSFKPEILAPADNLLAYNLNNSTSIVQGTSYASPLISAGIGLLKQAFPNRTGRELLEVILYTAIDMNVFGNDPETGYGRVNFEAAYNSLLNGIQLTLQNKKINDLNLDGSHLLVNNSISYPSPSYPVYPILSELDIKPAEQQFNNFKFYKWNIDGSRILEKDNQLIIPGNEEYITKFAETKPLTVRNTLEGTLDGGMIMFGEKDFDVISRVSPYTENAFIYNPPFVQSTYRAEASPTHNLFNTSWNFVSWEDGSFSRIREEQITQSSPAEWRAIYKGQIMSNDQNAISSASQRKIVLQLLFT